MKMSPSPFKWVFALAALFSAVAYTTAASASDVVVTRWFSGLWDQPEQENQGIVLQIVEQPDGSKDGGAYWFTYGDDLQTAWYVGVGPVVGNEVQLTLFTAFGVNFMEPAMPEVDANVEEIGTLTLTFQNCNRGTAVYETPEDALGSGEFPIRRLTKLYGSRCTGGISDDRDDDARPTVLKVHLWPARDDVTGSGIAKFKEQDDHTKFEVEVEDAPDGTYELFVCDESRGSFDVSDGEGEIEFRSPEEDDATLLTFDPRDCPIELTDATGIAFSAGESVLAEPGRPDNKPMKDDDDEEEIEVDLANTGIFPDAKGSAELEFDDDHTEFEVKIRDVPEGSYPLLVGGTEVGVIEAVQVGPKVRGEIEFRDPEEAGTPLLDFDPRGQLIEVTDGTDVILEATFPDE